MDKLVLEYKTARTSGNNKKAESRTPHFLSSNQDIVVCSQEQKCGLKYVIHTPGGSVWTSVERTYIEHWNYADMISICRVSLNIKN